MTSQWQNDNKIHMTYVYKKKTVYALAGSGLGTGHGLSDSNAKSVDG